MARLSLSLAMDETVDRLQTHSRTLRQIFAKAAARRFMDEAYVRIIKAPQPSDNTMARRGG
jgi:hypothetical protein